MLEKLRDMILIVALFRKIVAELLLQGSYSPRNHNFESLKNKAVDFKNHYELVDD